jgi:hypothetical protein
MHITKIITKDNQKLEGYLHLFRPHENPGYITFHGSEKKFFLKDLVSAHTEGERVKKDSNEIERARKYMKDARAYGWHEEQLPIQEWERETEIKNF